MSVVYSPACIKYSGNYAEMESKNGHPQQQQQKRYHHHKNSGLSRYRSAPSSLLTDLVEDSRGCVNEIEEASRGLDHHHHHHHHHQQQQQQQQQNRYVPCLGSEMEAMLAKLLSSSSSSSNNGWNNVKQEGEAGGSVFSHDRPDHLIYNSHEFQGFPNGSSCSSSSSSVMMSNNTMALENSVQSKMGSGNCSNLLMRQKSHPPGFLSNFSVRNGFVALGEQATTSTCGLNGTLTFSSGPSSCSGRMPQIAENGNETLEEEATTCVPSSRNLRNDNGSHRSHNVPSFTSDFWENSAFTAPKPVSTDNDEFIFSVSDALESQHADGGYHNLGLSHQLSLPSSSTKIASKERFLKIQGSVPCKIRAKRGFATHPRSIAERIRRTRISERIKKLQELFPKSDKQTSTADMLDLAVDYIKNLQEQVKVLTDTRAMCTCSSSQKQCSRPCA